MIQKIHPWAAIWVPRIPPQDVRLNSNSGARSLSSSKACPWLISLKVICKIKKLKKCATLFYFFLGRLTNELKL